MLLLGLACYVSIVAGQDPTKLDYYMNIYVQEDCNDYKSTQKFVLNDNSGDTGCINIDWAESFAVDVNGSPDGLGCETYYYGNENCQTELGNFDAVGNSGCKDPPVSRINMNTEKLCTEAD